MLQKQTQMNTRNSSIELLRMIAMIMIIFHHFAVHGGFHWDATSISITHCWYYLINMGGKIGVNVFVLISGYFLIDDKKIFHLEKILKFWGQVFFYSVVIYLVFGLTGYIDMGVKSFIKACLPITFGQWWFASTYFVLYLLHPFINKLLHSLDRALYQKLILLLVVCWSVIPTFTTVAFEGNSLLWFTTLYAIAGYIRLYGLNRRFSAKHYFVCFLIFAFLTFASSVVFTLLGKKISFFAARITHFFGQEKFTILLASLCLFMLFASIKMNCRKWINILSSATFGVYLIHDSDITRPVIWQNLFQNAQYQDRLFLIPYSIFAVVIVFVVCSLLDLLRQHIVEKPFMRIVRYFSEKIHPLFGKVAVYLRNFVF